MSKLTVEARGKLLLRFSIPQRFLVGMHFVTNAAGF